MSNSANASSYGSTGPRGGLSMYEHKNLRTPQDQDAPLSTERGTGGCGLEPILPKQRKVRTVRRTPLRSVPLAALAVSPSSLDSKSATATLTNVKSEGNERRLRAAQRAEILWQIPTLPQGSRPCGSLLQAREGLRKEALALGHPEKEVDAWVANDETTITLLSKVNYWIRELEDDEWTVKLASYFAYHHGALVEIPDSLLSNFQVQQAILAFDMRQTADRTKPSGEGCCSIS